MNTVEEQTAVELQALVDRAAAATVAPPALAQHVLTEVARPARRRARVVVGSLAALTAAGLVAAASVTGSSDHREWTQPSGAMRPTVEIGQTVLLDRRLAPQRGDVVLLRAQDGGGSFEMLSRVVGLPGDVVACPAEPDGSCRAVTVAGRPLAEPWLTSATAPFAPVQVPEGRAFLLGDARDLAADSRTRGPEPLDEVLGVAVARLVDGRREALPGTPAHELPASGRPVDPADPVPPARTG